MSVTNCKTCDCEIGYGWCRTCATHKFDGDDFPNEFAGFDRENAWIERYIEDWKEVNPDYPSIAIQNSAVAQAKTLGEQGYFDGVDDPYNDPNFKLSSNGRDTLLLHVRRDSYEASLNSLHVLRQLDKIEDKMTEDIIGPIRELKQSIIIGIAIFLFVRLIIYFVDG